MLHDALIFQAILTREPKQHVSARFVVRRSVLFAL